MIADKFNQHFVTQINLSNV